MRILLLIKHNTTSRWQVQMHQQRRITTQKQSPIETSKHSGTMDRVYESERGNLCRGIYKSQSAHLGTHYEDSNISNLNNVQLPLKQADIIYIVKTYTGRIPYWNFSCKKA